MKNTFEIRKLIISICLMIVLIATLFSFVSITNRVEDKVVYADNEVSYREYNSTTKEFETKTVTEYTTVTSSTTFDANGWYVVNSNVTITGDVSTDREINLILSDGCTLDITGKTTFGTLRLFGQENNTGVLKTCTDANLETPSSGILNEFGTLRIDGGIFNTGVRAFASIYCLYVKDTFVMNGGVLSAERMGSPSEYTDKNITMLLVGKKSGNLINPANEFTMTGGKIQQEGTFHTWTALHINLSDKQAYISGTIDLPDVAGEIISVIKDLVLDGVTIPQTSGRIGTIGGNLEIKNESNIKYVSDGVGQGIYAGKNMTIESSTIHVESRGYSALRAQKDINITNSSVYAESKEGPGASHAIESETLTINSVQAFEAITAKGTAIDISGDITVAEGCTIKAKNTAEEEYAEVTIADCETYKYLTIVALTPPTPPAPGPDETTPDETTPDETTPDETTPEDETTPTPSPDGKRIDPDNGVTIETSDGTAIPEDITLKVVVKTEVTAIEGKVDPAKVQEKISSKEKIAKVYDVKLIRTVGGEEEIIQPSDIKPGMKVKVEIQLPKGISAKGLRILHVHSDGTIDEISNLTVTNGVAIVEVASFSEFVLVTPASHGFCIGWVAFIFVILELLATCLYAIIRFGLFKDLVAKCKLDGAYAKISLLTLIGLCVAGAVFLFTLIALCVHQCAITIITFILAFIICGGFTFLFLEDKGITKLLPKKLEDKPQE